MARKYIFNQWNNVIQKPADWNPADNKFEVVAPGGMTAGPPPFPPGTQMNVAGDVGGSYAFAVNVDPSFPIGFWQGGNLMGGTGAGFYDSASNYFCLASPTAVTPQGNLGGAGGTFAGGGAAGPAGAGGQGGYGDGGWANAGAGNVTWFDPNTSTTYTLGDGQSTEGYTQKTWGVGSGPAGGALLSYGAPGTFRAGGLALGVISYEPKAAGNAAMVMIMA